MRNVRFERTLGAPRSSVWSVLADYPNIADWNEGLTKSYAIGDATEGVGAQRQTELVPDGAMRMRETVAEWVPEEKMVLTVDKIEKMPVKRARMTFTLSGDVTPMLTLSYDYEPKGGPLGSILGLMIDRQMKKGLSGFVNNLESEAQARNTT